jgi:hypothetical protein
VFPSLLKIRFCLLEFCWHVYLKIQFVSTFLTKIIWFCCFVEKANSFIETNSDNFHLCVKKVKIVSVLHYYYYASSSVSTATFSLFQKFEWNKYNRQKYQVTNPTGGNLYKTKLKKKNWMEMFAKLAWQTVRKNKDRKEEKLNIITISWVQKLICSLVVHNKRWTAADESIDCLCVATFILFFMSARIALNYWLNPRCKASRKINDLRFSRLSAVSPRKWMS